MTGAVGSDIGEGDVQHVVGRCFYVTRHSFAIQSERSPSTLAQKYTVTHPDEVSSNAMFCWSLGFERSAPKHVRDNHHCTGQVRIQPVVRFLRWDRRQCLCRADVDCWPASTLGRVGVRWSAPRRVRRWAPGGSPTPRAPEYEGDLNPEPRMNKETQVQEVRAPSLVESRTCSLWTPE